MKHLFLAACGRPARSVRRLLAGLTLLVAAPAAQAQLFGPVATYNSGTGGTPVGVAVGDFNADGFRDVVTANNALNTVGVLLGTGTGSLSAAASYGTGAGSAPQWVAVGDLNGDNRPDIVTANSGTSQVGVLLNNGSGGFGTVATYSSGAGSAPLGVALGDVNGDNKLDIVTANNGSNGVTVLLNTGSGTFNPGGTYATGSGSAPLGVALGDVNSDNKLDIVTANSGSSTIGVLLNSGTGTFGSVASYGTGTGSAPGGVALADLNSDGKLDIVTANSGSSTIGVLLNSGTGTFGSVATTSTGAGSLPAAVALADVNADGRLDAVTANSGTNTAGVLLGTGPGTFGTVTAYGTGTGSAPLDVKLADLNGDNLPDLLSNNNGSSTVGVLLNQNAIATISSFTPTTSRAGGTVTVTGTNLAGATGVTVNGVAGAISGTPTSTTLVFVVGAGSSTGLIRISTGGNTAVSSTNLTIVPTPVLISTSPTQGAVGTVLTVTGTDLQNPTAVTFTGVGGTFAAAAGYSTNVAGTTLSNVVVPSGLQPGPATFTVTTAGGASNSLSFQVTLPPIISSFSPSSGVAGTVITLTGSRLSDVTGVTVNGVAATFTLGTATSFTFTVPVGVGATQQVVLTSPGGTSVPSTGFTALLNVTGTNPTSNGRNAPVGGSALAVTFSEPVPAISAANLKVFSAQVGGRKNGTVAVTRSTARYVSTLPAPRTDFRPGEVVSVTVPATITGAGGLPASKWVYQFTTAVGATGTGFFSAGTDVAVPNYTTENAVGDFDGDGDLDAVSAGSSGNLVSVRFNNGFGVYSGTTDISITFPTALAVGDLDNDGDLDIVVGQGPLAGSTAVPLLNNGSGGFTTGTAVSLGASNCYGVTLGDFDGDGDLDVAGTVFYGNQLAIRFNNGSGVFSGSQQVTIGPNPKQVLTGDFDNDGDLDLLVCNTAGNSGSSYSARLAVNDGNGTFTAGNTLGTSEAEGLAVGDVDGDGDLDAVVMPYASTPNIDTYLNNGSGTFTYFSRTTQTGFFPRQLALADLDGDGDLDVAVPTSSVLTVRLNNGRGVFGGGQARTETGGGRGIVTGDLDGDGDLDLLFGTGNSPGTLFVRLNGPATYPNITSFSPTSGAQGTTVVITGTNLGGATSVSFNGTVTTTITNNTATSLTVQVPVGATTGYLTVVAAAGTSAPSPDPFTVVPPPTLTSFTPTTGPVGTQVTITGTNFTGATAVSFNGTAATTFMVTSATSITATVPTGASTGTISVTTPGGSITSTGTFTVIPPPVLSGISPTSGPVGAILTLTGTTLTGTTVITFGGSSNNTVTSGFTVNAAGTQITGVVVPGGATGGPVTVTTSAGPSNGLAFTLTTALAVTAVSPTPNNRAASLTSPSQLTFNRTLAAGSENALQVFSAQRGGKLTRGTTTPVVRSGNTLTYTPSQAYQAGETVTSVVTSAATGTGGETLLRPKAYQFVTGVSTGGNGTFQPGADYSIGTNMQGTASADVDGDGDLDMLVCTSGAVSVRLNNGNGTSYTGTQNVTSPGNAFVVATGDLDGDGDLDFVANGGGVIMVRFNTSGTFSGTQNLSISTSYGLALADVDGDADLDVVFSSTTGLGVSLNNGAGVFGTPQYTNILSFSQGIAVGDLDGDGDLDVLVGIASSPGYVLVMTNDGYGTFANTQTVTVNEYANHVVVADVDGDGDLDFATCSSNTGSVLGPSIGINNGSGNFGTRSVPQAMRSYDAALADVDGDGDPDLLTVQAIDNSVQLRRNDGTGIFGTPQSIAVGTYPLWLSMADVDSDGDLDMLVTNNNSMGSGTVSVRFNVGGTQPGITSINPTAGPVGSTVAITGFNLGAATGVSFNGTPATIASSTATTLVVTVPVGATTGAITVTTPSGTANSLPFTVTTPVLTSVSPTTVLPGYTITLTGSGLQATSTITFTNGVAVTSGFTVNAGGTQITGIVVPAGAVTGPVTATAGSTTSNGITLTIYQVPTITSFTPTGGPVGTSVTLTGTNLIGGTTTVRVNGTSGTITSNNGTTLVFTVNSGTTTGAVVVTTSGGTATGGTFTVQAAPVISALSPTSGLVGTSVTISGTNLAGATSVSFNGTVVASTAFTSNSATSIVLAVPAGATTGPVTVTTAGGPSNSVTFTVTAPQLAVTQNGTAYPSGGTAYSFGSQVVNTTSATVAFTLNNVGTASLTISGISTTGDFAVSGATPTTVAAGGTASVSVTFTPTATGTRTGTLVITSSLGTYTVNLTGNGQAPIPTITTLSPASGLVGDIITISGTNLSGAISVSFNGTVQATITNNTGTSLTVAVPAGATTGPVLVATPGGNSNSLPFTVTLPTTAAPVVTTPASGSLVNTATPTYSGTAPAASTVTVYVDGASIGTTTATGGNFTLVQPTALSQGSHTVRATAQSNGSNVSASSGTNSFTVDTVQPTVAITSSAGASGTTTTTSPIPFTITFSKSVLNFGAGSVSVTNGTVTGFTGQGTTYTVTVTPTTAGIATTVNVAANVTQDAAGNNNVAAPAAYSITYSEPPVVATAPPNRAVCAGSSTTFTATFTGATSYQWQVSVGGGSYTNLSNGGVYAGATTTTLTLTGVTASLSGNQYRLVGTNPSGSIASSAGTLTVSSIDLTSGSQSNATCNGGSNGAASVSPSGGIGSYTYAWTSNASTTNTATNLSAGTYAVTVTDGIGCTAQRTFTVTAPSAISLTSSTQTNVSCNGGTNGSATVSATGGTGAYSYSWTANASTAATATNLSAGTYTVTVTDANGCSAQRTFTIIQPAVLATGGTQTNVTCNSGATGAATVTVSGGTAGYTFAWQRTSAPVGPITASGSTAASSTISSLMAGSYTVTVTDANSCTTTRAFTIIQPTAISLISGSSTDVSCNGGTNGTATVAPTGGTGTYAYSWTNNGSTSATASNLSAGTYTVTVTDANGCTAQRTFTIAQPPVLTTTGTSINVSCNGSSTGSATVAANGGTGPYTYSWTANASTIATATGLAAGIYTVTVTDANGCTAQRTFTITQPGILATSNTTTPVACNGGATGAASVAVSGGTGGYTYVWQRTSAPTATLTPSSSTATNSIISNLIAGTYSVTVTDANGCTTQSAFNVTQPTAISLATGSQTNVTTTGGSNGSATVTPTGGTPGYSYGWSPNVSTTTTATGLSAGTYTVTVTDANGCTAQRTFIITQPAAVAPTVTTATPGSITPTSASLGGTVTASGGAAVTASGVVYSTTNLSPTVGGTGVTTVPIGSGTGAFAQTVAGLAPGTLYYVAAYATNSVGTSYGSVVQFTTTAALSTAAGTSTNVSCFGGSNGSATVAPSGGVAPYTYSWSPSVSTTATATGLSAGAYTVTVTDATGASAQRLFTITQPTAISLTTGSQTNVTTTGGSNGSATVTPTGGTPGYTYAWTANVSATNTAANLSAGTYTVTVADANGCTAQRIFTITQPAAVAPTVTTAAASGTTPTSASLGGTVTASGGATVTASGVVYSTTNPLPTVGGTGVTTVPIGSGTGAFAQTVAGLAPGTLYYVAAYATNSVGTSYGSVVQFTTPAPAIATSALSATAYCAGSALTVPFTVSASFLAGNVFTAQLSDASGSFATPTTIGTLTGTSSGSIAATLPAGTTGTGFRVRVVSSSPATTGSDNGTNITLTAPPVATFNYGTATSFCTTQATAQAVVLGTGATVGTFTVAPAAGLTLAANGAITLSTSTPGTYTVTNTVAASGGCGAATATSIITITAPQAGTFTYPAPSASGAYCAGTTTLLTPTLASGSVAGTYALTPGTSTGATLNASTGVLNLSAASAGTFTVTNTVAAAGGCAATVASQTVTVLPLPAAPTITTSGTPATGITLTATPSTASYTYLFYRNGVLVPGTTGNTLLVNSGTANGAYTVVAQNTNGCLSPSSTSVNVTVTATAPAQTAGVSLKLYPNPAAASGSVVAELQGWSQPVTLTLLDALGRVVRTVPAQATGTTRVDLRGLATGVYWLRAQAPGQQLAQRLMVE